MFDADDEWPECVGHRASSHVSMIWFGRVSLMCSYSQRTRSRPMRRSFSAIDAETEEIAVSTSPSMAARPMSV